MQERALKAGLDVGEVFYRKKQKDYVFSNKRLDVDGEQSVATLRIYSSTRFLGGTGSRISDFFSDKNPFAEFEAYAGVAVKTE